MAKQVDVVVVGAGHNGLVSATMLARRGLSVLVVEEKDMVGGAVKTEYPFKAAPRLGISSGAYLLGLMPPEILTEMGVELPLMRRDPYYFLPTREKKFLLFGSDGASVKRQMIEFFSEADWNAHAAMNDELARMRDDLAPAWLDEPLPIEETAERYIRPELRTHFINLCRGSARDYLERWGYRSDLLKAMYAVTDAFSGLHAGYDTPGAGHNLLVHNMCRLPGSGGTWMIVGGGMGTITQRFAAAARQAGADIVTGRKVARIEVTAGAVSGVAFEDGTTVSAKTVVVNADPFRMRDLVGAGAFPSAYNKKLDGLLTDGTTFKVNLCLKGLPKFTCLPEDRGQYGPTIHLLPDEGNVFAELERGYADVQAGRLAEFPTIEWYIHSAVDRSLQDEEHRHNSALFVQWVPYALSGGKSWDQEEDRYARHLLSICDRFAPGTSDLVVEMFPLHPAKIERHFGITRGHIHHVDNKFAFDQRVPYAQPGVAGLYSCSAGTHPAGSVIGAAGHNAARRALRDLGK